MRRNEVLGLKWDDIDFEKRRLGLNRGHVAIGYELHETRTSRRSIDLDPTLDVLAGWRAFQRAEFAGVGLGHSDGWVFTDHTHSTGPRRTRWNAGGTAGRTRHDAR